MPWKKNELVLYHGTDLKSARSIKANGVNLALCTPFADFGRAFYTTTFLDQAWSWARKRCSLSPKAMQPAVLRFKCAREVLGIPLHLFFTHEEDSRTEYWSFVQYCRNQQGPHIPALGKDYSIVSGPVSLWPQLFVMKDCDQVSFHSADPSMTRMHPRIQESILQGDVLRIDDLGSGEASAPVGRVPGVVRRAAVRQLKSGLETALAALGSPGIPLLVMKTGLDDVGLDDLTLHFDPRHLACVLSGLQLTNQRNARLSGMSWEPSSQRSSVRRGQSRASARPGEWLAGPGESATFQVMGTYELKKMSDGQFMFTLKVANGEVILTSERYTTKASAENGIQSVRVNSPKDECYERKDASSKQPYFVLKSANNEVIGRSETYSSASAMENGITSVKENGPTAKVVDKT